MSRPFKITLTVIGVLVVGLALTFASLAIKHEEPIVDVPGGLDSALCVGGNLTYNPNATCQEPTFTSYGWPLQYHTYDPSFRFDTNGAAHDAKSANQYNLLNFLGDWLIWSAVATGLGLIVIKLNEVRKSTKK